MSISDNLNLKSYQWGIGIGLAIVAGILIESFNSLALLLLFVLLLAALPAYIAAKKKRLFVGWWLLGVLFYPLALVAAILVNDKSDTHSNRAFIWQASITLILFQFLVLLSMIAAAIGFGPRGNQFEILLITSAAIAAASILLRFVVKDESYAELFQNISKINIKFLIGMGIVVFLGLSIIAIPLATVVAIIVVLIYTTKNTEILGDLWRLGQTSSAENIEEAAGASI